MDGRAHIGWGLPNPCTNLSFVVLPQGRSITRLTPDLVPSPGDETLVLVLRLVLAAQHQMSHSSSPGSFVVQPIITWTTIVDDPLIDLPTPNRPLGRQAVDRAVQHCMDRSHTI